MMCLPWGVGGGRRRTLGGEGVVAAVVLAEDPEVAVVGIPDRIEGVHRPAEGPGPGPWGMGRMAMGFPRG